MSHTMTQCDCIDLYTSALTVFLQALDAPSQRFILNAGVRQFLHRMMVCMDERIFPFIPQALGYLLSSSTQSSGETRAKEIHDFIPLINQLISKFKVNNNPAVGCVRKFQ